MPFQRTPLPKIYSQPQGPQKINYGNPIALGMIAAAWPKSNVYLTQNSNPVAGRDGRNRGVLAWEAQSISAANQPIFAIPSTTSSEWTIVADFGRVVGVNYQAGIALTGPGATFAHFMYLENNFKANGWKGSQGGGTFGVDVQSSVVTLTGFPQLAVTVSGVAQTVRLYGNGRDIGGSVGAITNTTATVSSARLFRNNDSYPVGAANGTQCSFFGIWNRVLTAQEIAAVNANPYQLVARSPQYFLYSSGSSATTIDAFVGNATAAGGGQVSVATSINFGVGNAAAVGSAVAVNEAIALGVGNAVAGGPAGATVSENTSVVALVGDATAAGQTFAITGSVSLSCTVGDANAAGQQCQVLPPLTVAPSATPGHETKARYRVRVGKRWVEVDPLDQVSVRRAYDLAQEDAEQVAEQDVEQPAVVAKQAVVVQPIKGPDYAGLAKEARRISEDIRRVYADALQTALIARLMREQMDQDDEDDVAVLLASI